MLKARNSSAIVAVRDIDRARAFYGETLGLTLSPDSEGDVSVFQTGDTHLVVYVSEFAGTNRANAVVWAVGDQIERIAADLADKGVTFERYEMDGATYADGIHRMGDFRMVWFKDPDGNILHLNSGD
jgi:catechol 2,3-dioxygenase-like lactoylglutathione lyase family enzyme